MGRYHQDGYSSDVKIYLRVDDRDLPASQVGPDRIVLREVASIPASTSAIVITSVDGTENSREVVVAVTDGQLDFGPWEQIFYGEFDGKRKKRVLVKIIGE